MGICMYGDIILHTVFQTWLNGLIFFMYLNENFPLFSSCEFLASCLLTKKIVWNSEILRVCVFCEKKTVSLFVELPCFIFCIDCDNKRTWQDKHIWISICYYAFVKMFLTTKSWDSFRKLNIVLCTCNTSYNIVFGEINFDI